VGDKPTVGRITQLSEPSPETVSIRVPFMHIPAPDAVTGALIAQAVLAERERCAKIADQEADSTCGWDCDCGANHSRDIAARIRGGK